MPSSLPSYQVSVEQLQRSGLLSVLVHLCLLSSVQSCVLVRAFAVQYGVKCITVLVSRVCFCSLQCNANVHCGDHIEGVQLLHCSGVIELIHRM